MTKEEIRREYRNEIINKLWTFNNIPAEAQKLMTEDDVQFMVEIVKIYANNCTYVINNGKATIIEVDLPERKTKHFDPLEDVHIPKKK